MKNQKPRRITSLTMAVLIVFSAMSVLNFASINVRASGIEYLSTPWNGDTYITVNDTFPHSPYDSAVLNLTDGNLIICDGVTLTFNDNVTLVIKNNDDSGDYGIQINDTAKFVVNSSLSTTTIKTHDDTEAATYSFTNSGTIDFLGATVERVYGDSDNSKMGGIINNPGSTCIMENCKLYDSDTHGISVDNSNLTLKGSNTRISPMNAEENDGHGIWINGSSNVEIEQITINNTQEYGIKCVNAENVTIKNNVTIEDTRKTAIMFEDSNASINYCTIDGANIAYEYGIKIVDDSNLIIENSSISNFYNGIYLSSATYIENITTEIKNCYFSDCNVASSIYGKQAGTAYIYNNTFEDTTGIFFDRTNFVIGGNTFNEVHGALSVDHLGALSYPDNDVAEFINNKVMLKTGSYPAIHVIDGPGSLLVKNNTIEANTSSSEQMMFSRWCGPIDINNNTFKNFSLGITIRQMSGSICDNEFINFTTGGTSQAIVLDRASVNIENNTFDNITSSSSDISYGSAIKLMSTVNSPIINNTMNNCRNGVYGYNSLMMLENNVIHNISNYGVYANISSVNINNNDFFNATNSVQLNCSNGNIHNNSIRNGSRSIWAFDGFNNITKSVFSDNEYTNNVAIPIGGGNSSTNITLPKNAKIMSASMNISNALSFIRSAPDASYVSSSGDFNSDDFDDLIIKEGGWAYGNMGYTENNASGYFQDEETIDNSYYGSSSATGDFNFDDDLDTISCYNNYIKYCQGDGTGNFSYQGNLISLNTSYTFIDLEPGLYNSDNYTDILTSVKNETSGEYDIRIYLNNGTGSFTEKTEINGDFIGGICTIASSDYDSDGDIDFVAINSTYDGLELYLNDGTGNFTKNKTIEAFSITQHIVSIDLTNDGINDIFCSLRDGSTAYSQALICDGVGNFSERTKTKTAENYTFITNFVPGNYYNDSYIDLLVEDSDDFIALYTSDLCLNTTLDIGIDGTEEWEYSGYLNISETFNNSDFANTLQSYIDSNEADAYGNVEIPLTFNSESFGTVGLSNLNITYKPRLTIENNTITENYYGIYIDDISSNLINNNDIFSNDNHGIHLVSSESNTITGNNISNNSMCGIYLVNNDENIVNSNSVISNGFGIVLLTSNNNSIYHNNINNTNQAYDSGLNNEWNLSYPYGGNYWSDYTGSDLYYGPNQNYTGADGFGDTSYNVIPGSSQDNYPLMGPIIDGRFMKPSFRIDSDSDFTTKSWIAPRGNGTSNNPWIIENYYVNGSGQGSCIYIGNTTENFTVENCDIYDASGNSGTYYWNAGIGLYNVTNGLVENNAIENSDNGIYIRESISNIIQENAATSNGYGLYFYESDNMTIQDNYVVSNFNTGVYLYSSENNTMASNNISLNNYEGLYLVDSDNNEIINSTVFDADYGIYVYLSDNVTLEDNTVLSNDHTGIYIHQSDNSALENNNASSNYYYGLKFYYSSNSMASNNSCYDNMDAFLVYYSNNITLENNLAIDNEASGIRAQNSEYCNMNSNTNQLNEYGYYLISASNNEILNSTVQDNDYGLYFDGSSDNNIVYYNNIIENIYQSNDDGSNNSWDNGYPSGGNYWDDYNGTDIYSGAGQSSTGSDGIGDNKYNSTYGQGIGGSANSVDDYPLFRPLSKKTWQLYNGWNYRTFTAEITAGWDSSDLALDIIEYLNSTYNQTIQKSNITIDKYNPLNDTTTKCWYNQTSSSWVSVFDLSKNEAYNISLLDNVLSTAPLLYELPNDAIEDPGSFNIYNGYVFCGLPVTSLETASDLAVDIVDYMNETYNETISKSQIQILKYNSATGSFQACYYFSVFDVWLGDFDLVAQDGYYVVISGSPLTTSPREYVPPAP